MADKHTEIGSTTSVIREKSQLKQWVSPIGKGKIKKNKHTKSSVDGVVK